MTDPDTGSVLTPALGDRLLLVFLVILIAGVPTVFLRTTFTTFNVPQLTLLWMLAVAVALVGLYRVVVSGVVERGPRVLAVASTAFLAALVLTSLLSDQPWVAFTGLTARGAGAVTYGLCLALMHAVYRLGLRNSLQPIVLAFVVAHALVVLYALLQAYGLDPFSWGAGILYVGPVFSTLGNPNFSAGFAGLTLPLVAWVAFGSRLRVVFRVMAGAGIGASLAALTYLNSFQGDVAAMAAAIVIGQWAWQRSRRSHLVTIFIALPGFAVIAGVPLLLDAPGRRLVLVLMVILGLCAGLGARWDRDLGSSEVGGPTMSAEPQSVVLLRGRLWIGAVVALVFVSVGGVIVGGRIFEQLGSGLEQRFAFWRASLSIFASNPIVGTGLETYQAHFSAHRPFSHATQYEYVLSDSPHSVPLGLLSGGGILLATAYLFLMAVVLRSGWLAIRRTDEPNCSLYSAVMAAWIAYHIQSLVSMDVPGLIYTQWVLGGVLLAGGLRGERSLQVLPWAPGSSRSLSSRNQRWRKLGVALPVVFVLVLFLGPLTAPLRADSAAFWAQEALDRMDYQTAGNEMLRAIDLQPQNGLYADGMALVYEDGGLLDLAYKERVRSARLRPGNPFAALNAARAAIGMGYLEDAEYWYDRAVMYEPHGAEVLAETAWFFAQIGRVGRAAELLDVFQVLETRNVSAWKTASDTYMALGDEVKSAQARLCGTYGQEGCWGSD